MAFRASSRHKPPSKQNDCYEIILNVKKRIFGRSADEVQKDLNQAKEYKVDKNQEEQGKTLLKETVPSIDHSLLSNCSRKSRTALSTNHFFS